MHNTVKNLIYIEELIKSKANDDELAKVIAVSKTFPIENVLPLIEHGHLHYGENKVQEALDKWSDIKLKNNAIKLHLIGRLQTNKVKFALRIFDYIHSLDSEKLAIKISEEQKKQEKKPKIFIQVNIGNEDQKSGINKDNLIDFYKFCKNLNLDIIGTMCIPPNDDNTEKYFSEMNDLNKEFNFKELSMGMSGDYLEAIRYNATYIRVGSKIFGSRT
ncbi:YggS family pyridoxal phosphate-dependent enzyme [Candidatus Pelagibacter ubique]|jgi:pyridoxal phosphate enzyme (YggS family)|nr:YggS family pyridoxal phosphate-dependent enzyme [Candidatus Pelagibacter bacterium]MDA9063299.1 YggS family pyridoxal phosphate-dependent enzyme [Candidatus Pelagibacter ubique]MDB2709276.1 YggS family pyridoxal phosphate-dependent enzyme [Candidatus Pelagibacter bacterium]MDC0532404.1 YggS family pyridoxal phosphate-dependent enzyme [Candidatus Pelagibacter ubique]